MAVQSKIGNVGGPRNNERLVLACLRYAGRASKPELARQVALTPQAVHGIVDGLIDAGLVEAGGRREGAVGYPSTLYSIKSDGAYAIGIEFGVRKLEAVLVNLAGQMVYRGQVIDAELNVTESVTSAIQSILVHARTADIDLSRIAGVGLVMTSAPQWGDAVMPIGATLSAELSQKHGIEFPFHVERDAVAGAMAMAISSKTRLPSSYLFISVGASVDGCIVHDGMPLGGRARQANHFRHVPVSSTQTLGDIVGFDPLARRLGTTADLSGSTETFFRKTQAHPAALAEWLDDSADALATAIASAHAFNDLGGVFIRIAPPNAIGDLIVEGIRQKLRERAASGIAYPTIHREHYSAASSAMCAATMVLVDRYGQGRPSAGHTSLPN